MAKKSVSIAEKQIKKHLSVFTFVIVLKILAWLVTDLKVLVIESIFNTVSLMALIATYFSITLSKKHADKKFEYGYYKVETLVAFIIAFWVVFLGGFLFYESVQTFFEPSVAQNQTVAIFATLFAIYKSKTVSAEIEEVADAVNSLALRANAFDKRIETYTGIAVLISIFANFFTIPYVEGLVSSLIAIFILLIGFQLAKDSILFLLDYWDDPSLNQDIRKVLRQSPIVHSVKKVRLRRAGIYIFGEAYIEVLPFIDPQDLKGELEILETRVHQSNMYLKDFAIFTQIYQQEKIKIAIPLKKGRSLNAEVTENMKHLKGYLILTLKNKKVAKQEYYPIKAKEKNPTDIIHFFKEHPIDILVDHSIGSIIYFYLRRNQHTLIYPSFSDVKKAQDVINMLVIDK
jgi:cation diffusion facilitator family transporter